MKTLLVRDAEVLVTMDGQRRELRGGSLLARGPAIEAVWAAGERPADLAADEVIDARGHAVLPGLVNTHHHMYQSLTRAVPGAQDASLFQWLKTLYPIWLRLTPEMIGVSTQLAMAELLRSGCTTSSDHLYLFPNGARLDDSLEAAAAIGMRFHAARGSMSVGESAGGLPPDAAVEDEAHILRDTQRLIEAHHDPARFAMQRVVAAPCSPFSVSPALMKESAALARALGTRLHTHLAENDHDVAYSLARFGQTPAQYAESLGWLGPDVWHAHGVRLDPAGIAAFGASGTGIAHCPCSNMRLASGIAPVRRWLQAGVKVGLGVDGSASNDGAHLLAEARMAMLLARVGAAQEPPTTDASGATVFGCDHGAARLSARDALELATRGGADVLGRDDIGHLAPGMAADLAVYDLGGLDLAGAAVHDPVAALLLCTPPRATHTVVNGRVVVRDGELCTLDTGTLVQRHNRLARQLLRGD